MEETLDFERSVVHWQECESKLDEAITALRECINRLDAASNNVQEACEEWVVYV